jgi:phenylacetate-CoA ligase
MKTGSDEPSNAPAVQAGGIDTAENCSLPSWWDFLWAKRLQGLALAPFVTFASRQANKRAGRRDLVVACQTRRLRRIVEHAGAHVPFYREYYKATGVHPAQIRSSEDLARLPFLTKNHLRKYLPALLAENRRLTFCELHTTSGSTGVPIKAVVPLSAQFHSYTRLQARLPQLGLRPSDFRPLAPTYVYVTDSEPVAYLRRWSQRLPVFRLARFEKRDFRPEFVGDQLSLLQELWRMRPVYLHGKPSSLSAFARTSATLDPEGRFRIRPKVVVTGAEQLIPQVRALLMRAYQCPVFDSYGLQEVGPFACECVAQRGLHVEDDGVIVEIVRDGKRVPQSESGEVVVTDLCNWTMPILRYRTGDIARMTYEPCECGLAYPRLVLIEGRTTDLFATPSGKSIHPYSLLGRLDSLDLAQFQLVQRSLQEVVVRYVGDVPERTVCEAIESRVHHFMGQEVCVRAERVSSLDRPGRKTQLYVSELKPRLHE